MFFIIHLRMKEETEFNGTESYIMEKIRKSDISWFPIGKSLSLSSKIDE